MGSLKQSSSSPDGNDCIRNPGRVPNLPRWARSSKARAPPTRSAFTANRALALQARYSIRPNRPMDTNFYDVVVCGGETTGLVAAALLARRGLRVLLLGHEPAHAGFDAWG